jgi:hypothetical protein
MDDQNDQANVASGSDSVIRLPRDEDVLDNLCFRELLRQGGDSGGLFPFPETFSRQLQGWCLNRLRHRCSS